MVGFPVPASKRQLRRGSRVDIAVEKNGYSNLDVKRIWIDPSATSRGVDAAEPDLNPMAGRGGSGVF